MFEDARGSINKARGCSRTLEDQSTQARGRSSRVVTPPHYGGEFFQNRGISPPFCEGLGNSPIIFERWGGSVPPFSALPPPFSKNQCILCYHNGGESSNFGHSPPFMGGSAQIFSMIWGNLKIFKFPSPHSKTSWGGSF